MISIKNQKTADDITEIVNDYCDYYAELLKNTEWLSKDSREAAIKKVENFAVHVGKLSIEVDFADCNIKSAKDGGSFLEVMVYNKT